MESLDFCSAKRSECGARKVNVSAHSPRIQQTLSELGFVPVAYIPALAAVGIERLDVVKMFRVTSTVRISTEELTPQSRPVAELVLSGFGSTLK